MSSLPGPGHTPLSPHVPELGALELLLAVVRLGSLGRAAAELGITQPAASARIAAMERQIGVTLLERSPRGSRPTEAGALVAEWAAQVVGAAQALDAGVAALREHRDARLRVSASLTVAEYLMPGWLLALHAALPDTAVTLRATNSAQVAEQILAGEADLGFVEGVHLPTGVDGAVVAHDRLLLVVAPSHRWARRRTPPGAAEVAAMPLILREQGSGTREVLDAALAAHGGLAEPLLTLASTTALKAATTSGAGPAVISELAVADELASGRLVAVAVPDLVMTRPLRAVWPKGARPAGPARELLSLIRTLGAGLSSGAGQAGGSSRARRTPDSP